MSYKVVRNANGIVIAAGPNDDGFVPVIPVGALQTIEEAMPPPNDEQFALQAKAAKDAADAQAAREDAQLSAIAAMTPAQAVQWIENNVTNLAEAKNALKTMAKAICVLARRI